MPDNNFEEDVRQKMEELRFVPNGEVWKNVEENIRSGRRRRRMLFWLPLTGLLVGGILWFAMPSVSKQDQSKATAGQTSPSDPASSTTSPASPVTAEQPASGAPAGKTAPVQEEVQHPVLPSANPSAAVKDDSEPRQTASQSVAKQKNVRQKAPGERPGRNKVDEPIIISEADYLAHVSRNTELAKQSQANRKNSHVTGKSADVPAGGTDRNNSRDAAPVAAAPSDQAEVATEGTPDKSTETPSVAAKKNVSPDAGNPAPATAAPLAKQDSKKPEPAQEPKTGTTASVKKLSKKSRIEWGFSLSGGISSQQEKNAISQTVLARAFAASTVYVIQNANLKPGPAFSGGFVAAKQIGSTWRVQTGLQYAYFSSRLPASSTPVFYNSALPSLNAASPAPGNQNNKHYTNSYQFFQIPVAVEKQFGKNSPFSAQAGLAFGYLSNVHALIYQPLLDQYSSDNSKFNRFQVSGVFGLYWKLKVDPKWSLRAGPELQYVLTDLMKTSVSVNDHLLTGGVRLILLHSGK